MMVCNSFFSLSCFSGSEHQELQVPAVADFAELSVSASSVTDWYSTTEQSDGTVVTHAFPHASCLPITQRVQGMVQ